MIYNIYDIIDVLSESTVDTLYNNFDYAVFNENTDNNETKKESKVKKVIDGASKAYITGLNKSSEAISKTFIRKPKEGASDEIQQKYQEKLIKAKAAIKVGEILISKTILIGPLDVIATAALVNGITKSDDPTDKIVMDKLRMLMDKAKSLKLKVISFIDKKKDKEVTNVDKQQYDAMSIQGMNIAKEMDAVRSRIDKNVDGKNITESTIINKFDEYLLKEDGTLVDNACEILSMIVEKTDYEKFDIFDVVEHYIDMII